METYKTGQPVGRTILTVLEYSCQTLIAIWGKNTHAETDKRTSTSFDMSSRLAGVILEELKDHYYSKCGGSLETQRLL